MAGPPSLTLDDYMLAYFAGAVDGSVVLTGSQPITITNPSSNPVTIAPYDQTGMSNTNQAVAPGAAAQICVVALSIGTWDIFTQTFVAGTSAPLDSLNMELRSGATPLHGLITPTATVPNPTVQPRRRIKLAGAGNVSINATAAATAGTTYYATVSAVRVR